MSTTELPPETPQRTARPSSRQTERLIVRGIVGVAGLLTFVTSSAAPTGVELADRLWATAFVCVLTFFSSRSRRYPWLWMAGVALAASVGSWWVIVAVVAMAGALVSAFRPRRNRVLGSLIGAGAGLTLLHLPSVGFHGSTALIAAAAVIPVLASGYTHSPDFVRKTTNRIALGGAILIGLVTAVFGLTAILVRDDLNKAVDQAQSGIDQVRDGKQADGSRNLTSSSDAFGDAGSNLDQIWVQPARLVPVIGQQLDALKTAASAGHDLTETAADSAASAPYQQLKASGGSIDLNAVIAMQEPVAQANVSLLRAVDQIEGVQSSWLLPPIADALGKLSDKLDSAVPEAQLAERALGELPGLLGGEGERTYLVLFTSPSESRNLGGFTGSYGVLTANDGQVDFTVSGTATSLLRDSEIDPGTITIEGQDEFLVRYDRYSPTYNMQNLTVSPDMGTTADVSRQIYRQITGTEVDGVLVVDPLAIAAILQLTGPVEVEGLDQPLTAENAATYLLHDQYVQYEDETGADETGERRDLLEAAGRSAFDALTSADLPGPRQIGQVLGPVVEDKHLMFFPFDDDERSFMTSIGADGVFAPSPDRDFVSVRTANVQPNKIDYFLKRSIIYDAAYDPTTGAVRSTATIQLQNSAPADGLPDYVIGGQDNPDISRGTTKIRVTLYSPLQVETATVDGATVGVETQRELGAATYSVTVTVPPGRASTLQLTLTGTIPAGTTYGLDVFSQPMVTDDQFGVRVASSSPAWRPAEGKGFTISRDAATQSKPLGADTEYRVEFEPR